MVSRLQGGKSSERISNIAVLAGELWVSVDNPTSIYIWDMKVGSIFIKLSCEDLTLNKCLKNAGHNRNGSKLKS